MLRLHTVAYILPDTSICSAFSLTPFVFEQNKVKGELLLLLYIILLNFQL